jgi:hypothetical protein
VQGNDPRVANVDESVPFGAHMLDLTKQDRDGETV